MSVDNVLASVAVRDLDAAIDWYRRLFARAPDGRPMDEVAEWRFERGGWLQVYRRPERAGAGSCTFAVSDLDEIVAHVERMGLDTGERTENDKVRTLMITDPDGNHLAFAEALDPGLAR